MTKYEAVFQALPGPVLIFDRAGHVESANPAALELLWARASIGLGLELQSVPELLDEVTDFGQTEEPERRKQLRLLTRAGPRALDVVMRRIDEQDPEGGILVSFVEPPGAAPVGTGPGQGARDAPIASLARMGHRVRTSMNGVLGMTGLLAGTGLSTEQRDIVESIKTSAESLVTLLDDWLDVARIESGHLDVAARSFSLRESIEEAMAEARARTADAGVRIQWEVTSNTPDALKGDARHFRQALINLVSSMVDEAPGAPIQVMISNSGQVGGTVLLHGMIAGPGSGQNQAEPSVLSTLVASTRLAAWLSRKLIDRMGGSVWVEVGPEGTPVCHFRLGFPIDEPREQSVRPPPRRPLRVLVAEDNAINRKVVCMLLERWGHHARAVRDGVEAVEVFEPSRFDLVLMDLQMPRMDGLEAARAIREKEGQGGDHVPIHALTAHSLLDRDPSHCFEAGMDGYLIKPIRADELLKVLDEVATGSRVEDVVFDPGPVVVKSAFDYEEALDRLDGEEDLLLEVASVFLEDCPTTMNEIRDALARHDADAVAMTAHRLKGALGTLAARAAHETASRLEKAARDHDFGTAGNAWKDLQRHVAVLLPELRTHVKS